MQILNIAEKPSVAKSISYLLSQNITKQPSRNKYTPIHKFTFKNDQMVFTSLLGHLFTMDFENNKDWHAVDPKSLFNEKIIKKVNKDQESIKYNIQNLSNYADMVIIWTDCDREGENIGKEIYDVVKEKHRNKIIKRARFNAITYTNILNAFENLQDLNLKESEAVDARIELDLRLGSAFTRIQSLNIQRDSVISYGPCQIPTLGFVVERMKEVDNFIPEDFYDLELIVDEMNGNYIKKRQVDIKNSDMKVTKDNADKAKDVFMWARGSVFDKNLAIYMYKLLNQESFCIIKQIETKSTQKTRPLPLRTVEFQKSCSSFFKISSHEVMNIAEKLYTRGYISYPRTETDVFPTKFNFTEIINHLSVDHCYNTHCNKLNEENMFVYPRKGSNNDMAHSPIYPLKDGSGLEGNDRKIFDFIARRFLGCISKNAIGEENKITAQIAKENFVLTGLKIKEKNYLEIYTFDKWTDKKIFNYNLNSKIKLETGRECNFKLENKYTSSLNVNSKKTSPPNYLTESELISLMDKNGIGTDATIAEHIQKIQDRKYAYKKDSYIKATSFGLGLVYGYEDIGLKDLYKPFLRGELEKNLVNICKGTKNKDELVISELNIYMHLYDKLVKGLTIIKQKINDFGNDDDTPPKDEKSYKIGINKYKQNGSNDDHKKQYSIKQKITGSGSKIEINTYGNDGNNNNDVIIKQMHNNLKARRENKKHNNSAYTKENILFNENDPYLNKLENVLSKHTKTNKDIKEKLPQKRINCSSNILCHCKKEVKKNIVNKSGVNKGKEFFSCINWPNGCNYFEWTDNQKEDYNENNKENIMEEKIKCFCGFEPQIKTANTETNKGRNFYNCKKAYKPCKFFQWVD
ncbi:Karyopherin transporter [Conglomerata obtusa]